MLIVTSEFELYKSNLLKVYIKAMLIPAPFYFEDSETTCRDGVDRRVFSRNREEGVAGGGGAFREDHFSRNQTHTTRVRRHDTDNLARLPDCLGLVEAIRRAAECVAGVFPDPSLQAKVPDP